MTSPSGGIGMDIDLTNGCWTAKLILPTLYSHPDFSIPGQDYRNWVLVGFDLGIPTNILKEIKKTADNGKSVYDGFQVVTQVITEWIQEKMRNEEKAVVGDLVGALKENRLEVFGEAIQFAFKTSTGNWREEATTPPDNALSRIRSNYSPDSTNLECNNEKPNGDPPALTLPLQQQQQDNMTSYITPFPDIVLVKQEKLSDISDIEDEADYTKDEFINPVTSSTQSSATLQLSMKNRNVVEVEKKAGAAHAEKDEVGRGTDKWTRKNWRETKERRSSNDSDATVVVIGGGHSRSRDRLRSRSRSSSRDPRRYRKSERLSRWDNGERRRNSEEFTRKQRNRSRKDSSSSSSNDDDSRERRYTPPRRSNRSRTRSRPPTRSLQSLTDFNSDGFNRFHRAVKQNRIDSVFDLIHLDRVDPNQKANDLHRNTALHLAAWGIPDRNCAIEMIKILIRNGAKVDSVNSNNATFIDGLFNPEVQNIAPINPAQFHELVKFLINCAHKKVLMMPSGANRDQVLHRAMRKSIMGMGTVNLLHFKGIGLNFQSENGNALLFYAIVGGRDIEMLKYLIDFGADWKHLNKDECNLLHVCAQFRNLKAFEYFIKMEPKFVLGKNKDGLTPVDVFKKYYHNDDVGLKIILELVRQNNFGSKT